MDYGWLSQSFQPPAAVTRVNEASVPKVCASTLHPVACMLHGNA